MVETFKALLKSGAFCFAGQHPLALLYSPGKVIVR
jgi:hypothetical protein